MRIPEYNTNLTGRCSLLRELADLIDDLFRRDFEPCGWCTGIWDRAGRYAFAVAVEATHDCELSIVVNVGLERKVELRLVGAKSSASGFLATVRSGTKVFLPTFLRPDINVSEDRVSYFILNDVVEDWMPQP